MLCSALWASPTDIDSPQCYLYIVYSYIQIIIIILLYYIIVYLIILNLNLKRYFNAYIILKFGESVTSNVWTFPPAVPHGERLASQLGIVIPQCFQSRRIIAGLVVISRHPAQVFYILNNLINKTFILSIIKPNLIKSTKIYNW